MRAIESDMKNGGRHYDALIAKQIAKQFAKKSGKRLLNGWGQRHTGS